MRLTLTLEFDDWTAARTFFGGLPSILPAELAKQLPKAATAIADAPDAPATVTAAYVPSEPAKRRGRPPKAAAAEPAPAADEPADEAPADVPVDEPAAVDEIEETEAEPAAPPATLRDVQDAFRRVLSALGGQPKAAEILKSFKQRSGAQVTKLVELGDYQYAAAIQKLNAAHAALKK